MSPRGGVRLRICNRECSWYGAGCGGSVALLSRFVVRLAPDSPWSKAVVAVERCGKSTLRGITDPRSDLADRQMGTDQKFSSLMQAPQPDKFLRRKARFAGKACVEALHGKARNSREVPDFKWM